MTLTKKPGGWETRLRYGAGQRGRFLICVESETLAKGREARLQAMATKLAAAGKHAEARVILTEAAAEPKESEFAKVERMVDRIAAEGPAPTAAPKGPRTFRDVAELWLSGELRRRYPDDVKAKAAHSVAASRGLMTLLLPILGDKNVADITLDDAERAKAAVPAHLTQATRAQYARHIRMVVGFAQYPLRLIEQSPIPAKFVPSYGHKRAFGFLYPDEDAQLVSRKQVELEYRFLYGFLARNGMRISEALALIWADFDLERGVLTLDKNKTRSPRAWVLGPDVLRALVTRKGSAAETDLVFQGVTDKNIAARFRAHLKIAQVNRRELHAETSERRPLRIHDLRGTFVTLALASGATETWVMDRTGHTSSAMLAKYRRPARHVADLDLGWLHPLDEILKRQDWTPPKVGQGLGQRVKIPYEMPGFKTCEWSLDLAEVAQNQPKTATLPLPSGAVSEHGPAGLSGVGQDSPVEIALAAALTAAIAAQRWDVALEITRELGERRRYREQPAVASIDAARRRKNGDK
jgi:integrase